ncbi:PREDICTED: uncharacterized protein LOC106790963 [Polistes canadensis]|uniref:uncharacterized protein LOC106790963 n=1 Tax=Polistes canadensis TaxID=91411 RepID=UPI000718FCDB|nr:PREDICTED: uncharacterized protein LOC106790963 [Polistes canadensis]
MSNEDLLPENNEETDYEKRVLLLLRPYKKLNKYSFCLWLNKFEYIADMIEIPNDKMVEIFNKMVDNNVQEVIKQNNPSVNFSALSYEEIINQYFRYFTTMDVKYVHRIRFVQRYQYKQEPLEIYANSLHKIYNKCEYRDEREKKLCDKFINGIRDNEIKAHIKKLSILPYNETVEKVLEIAEFEGLNNRESETHPTINTYSPENEGLFYVWLNKFEYVADVLNVSNHRMVEYFNTMVDDNVHTNVKNANPSINFSELSYDEIINYYLKYFAFADETDLHRKRFLCRKQYELEAIQNYAVRLRKIYARCHYNDYLEGKLSKQFLHGIRDRVIITVFKVQNCLLYVDIVSMAIEFKKLNERNTYKNQNFLLIDTYSPVYDGSFFDWLNKFEYIVHIAKREDMSILKIFNERVDNDIHLEVQEANPSINFSELSYDEVLHGFLHSIRKRENFFMSGLTNLSMSRIQSCYQMMKLLYFLIIWSIMMFIRM